MKRKVLIISAVLILVLGAIAGVVVYLFLQSVSHPPEETAKFLPEETALYVSMNLRPGADQLMKARGILDLFQENPSFEERLDELYGDIEEETGINVEEDLFPWVGPEVAMAILSLEGIDEVPEIVAFIGATDSAAAESFLRKLMAFGEESAGTEYEEEVTRGYLTFVVDPADDFSVHIAVTDDYIVIATTEGMLESTLDRMDSGQDRDRPSLFDNPGFQEAREAAESPRFGMMYLDVAGIFDQLEDDVDEEIAEGLGGLSDRLPDFIVDSSSFIDKGIRISASIDYPALDQLFVPALTNSVGSAGLAPEDTVAFLSFVGMEDAWESLERGDTDLLGMDLDEAMGEIEAEIGVDLEQDIFSWMTGELAFAMLLPDGVSLSLDEIHANVYVEFDDRAEVLSGMKKIQDAIEDEGVEFRVVDIEGIYAVVTDVGDEEGLPNLTPGYVVLDDYVVIGTTLASLRQAVDAERGDIASLQGSSAFSRPLEAAGGSTDFLMYANIRRVVREILDQMDETELEQYGDTAEPFVDPLEGFLLGVNVEEDIVTFSSVITFAAPTDGTTRDSKVDSTSAPRNRTAPTLVASPTPVVEVAPTPTAMPPVAVPATPPPAPTVAVPATAQPATVGVPPLIAGTDREALEALYDATQGSNWSSNYNWLSDAPLVQWLGVTTGPSGRVRELALSNNQLSGYIPAELGSLTNLKWLVLSDNQLFAEIPADLGNLVNLEGLYLWNNELSGELPAELGNLANLEYLDLSDNQLSGELPAELGNLANLEYLDLSENQLSGGLPAELGNLANLRELYLDGNRLSGCVPDSLRDQLYHWEPEGLPFCGAAAPSATIETDREALVALYNATNGANWSNNDNWLSDRPIGEWHGVSTDRSVRVTEILLSEKGLSGEIPVELGSLANLQYLDLSENQLSGEIPVKLGSLSNLEELGLSGNRLSGTIPSEIGSLSNLRRLYLSNNRLSGRIPSELGKLSNLKILDIGANQLSGRIPSELGRLSNLTALVLFDNRLSGAIPPELGGLSNLTELALSENQLRGCVPDSLRDQLDYSDLGRLSSCDRETLAALYNVTNGANWTRKDSWLSERPIGEWYGVTTDGSGRVTEIDLANNRLSGTIPSELGRLSNLRGLWLAENRLSGRIPPELGNLSNLENLDINANDLSGTIPTELGNLSNLGVLLLAGNQLNGTIPSQLGRLPNLRGLYLAGNQLSGTIPSELSKLSNLELLDISLNRLSGTIPPELGKLPNLKELWLAANRLSGTIPSELGRLSNLTELALAENRLSGTIPSELGRLSNLRGLWLGDNRLSGKIPSELGRLSNLRDLTLAENQLSGCLPDSLLDQLDYSDLGTLPSCDREVLVALYNSTNGANWTRKSGWLSDRPIGEWQGVTTDRNGRVTAIDLSENRLSGTIPAELGNLPNLGWLWLAANRLSGTIPSELGRLSDLRGLWLFDNRLSGTIPSELGSLSKLEELALSENRLSGTIPAELGRLSNLGQLHLSNNRLSGAIPAELAGLSNLQELGLSGNQLSGTIPSQLGKLSYLESLYINFNRLSGTIPSQLGSLSNLRGLYLANNRLIGCVPAELRHVDRHDFLDLRLPFCGAAPSGPYVVGKPTIVSRPSHDSDGDGAADTYGPTDIIEIEVRFSEQVCGTGSIYFTLQTGNGPENEVEAGYSGCSPNAVYFSRQIDGKDLRDGDGISIPANAIRGLVTHDGVVPNTAHPAVPADPNHKFDGSLLTDRRPPTLNGAPSIWNDPVDGNTFRRGEVIEVEARFSEPVTVRTRGGLPTIGLEIGDVTRRAKYSSMDSSDTVLVFVYTVQAGDKDDDRTVWVPAASIIVPSGSAITDLAGNDALISYEYWSVSSGSPVKVDGS